jgi:hypothetical protein
MVYNSQNKLDNPSRDFNVFIQIRENFKTYDFRF